MTTPILLQAQAVLATTGRAWQVQQMVPDTTDQAGRGVRRTLRGPDVAAARLVSRIYRYANAPLRAEMLACLLRPLSTLSLVAVASGAFAALLQRDGAALVTIPLEMAARFSSEQILELTLFVHEVSPGALEQLTALLNVGATGAVALSASALVLLSRRLGLAPAPTATRAIATR
ncbi:MAG: hypothetical protein Q8L49_04660 [Burkholderiaceae bacterium]|nr:hypothetical protein [Burkholderiaceae bacterium]